MHCAEMTLSVLFVVGLKSIMWCGQAEWVKLVLSNMLLVSDYFCASNTCQKDLKPDTCEPPTILRVYMLLDLCLTSIMYLRQVSGFNIDIYIYLNEIKLLKPVICCYWLSTHSAWSRHLSISTQGRMITIYDLLSCKVWKF